MTPSTRLGSAALFAIVSIVAVGPAAALEQQKPTPDPQLCEAFLRDLKTWRAQAIAIGCEVPPDNAGQTSSTGNVEFPPVVTAEATPPAAEFPPVVTGPSSSSSETDFPPVEQASAEPAPADFPPVTSSSSKGTGGGSSGFPPVDASSDDANDFPPVEMGSVGTDDGFEEEEHPIRAAIKEKLIELKEEAKARVRDAIVLKGEEIKERVKEKIKNKIEDVIARHQGNNQPTLRRAAKDAVKRMISERRQHGGGLMNKLAQLRRR
ncbi:MAG: hypothetical protein WDN31_07125 [Hyphomicrobium sp.]